LLDFLAGIEADYLFLVGDIVDFRSLRRVFHWPQEHNDVMRAILAMAKEGTQVIYAPGNHDRRAFGLPYWSLATCVKLHLGNAVRYVEAFETAAAQSARARNLDGVICTLSTPDRDSPNIVLPGL
jgi:UDP-2,3-diacylglucosamine pyrophosphatase LpxH